MPWCKRFHSLAANGQEGEPAVAIHADVAFSARQGLSQIVRDEESDLADGGQYTKYLAST